MRRALLVAGTAVLAVLAGCGLERDQVSDRPLVVATTTQVGDLVRVVGGSRVEIRQLLAPNADPHEYEPRPSDARALTDAKLVFRSGGEVDEWLAEMADDVGTTAPVAVLSDSVRERRDEEGRFDPHWWQDPHNAVLAVRAIRDRLTALDPSGRETFARRADSYLQRLDRLDRAIASCMSRIPSSQRKLVTDHDALGYLIRRYKVELVGTVIPSLSTAAQPSSGELADLAEKMRQLGVRTVFPEQSLSPKLIRALASEADVRVGRPLWADALGPKGSGGVTYIDSVRSNALALVDGFSGGKLHCKLPH